MAEGRESPSLEAGGDVNTWEDLFERPAWQRFLEHLGPTRLSAAASVGPVGQP